VARVPVRRILTNVLLSEKFFYNESEHLLMGGQRWRLVFGSEMEDEMRILKGLSLREMKQVLMHIMQIWEGSGDEEVVRALRELWRELRAAHGQS